MIVTEALRRFFWEHVDRSDPGGCWGWTGSVDSKNYGRVKSGGKAHKAHRIAYAIAFGDPGDLFVCHRCDNPICVRADHLFLGTIQDNNSDRDAKGRHARGPALGARQRNRTHCPKGHPYSPENTYRAPDSRRLCRTCQSAHHREVNRARAERLRNDPVARAYDNACQRIRHRTAKLRRLLDHALLAATCP